MGNLYFIVKWFMVNETRTLWDGCPFQQTKSLVLMGHTWIHHTRAPWPDDRTITLYKPIDGRHWVQSQRIREPFPTVWRRKFVKCVSWRVLGVVTTYSWTTAGVDWKTSKHLCLSDCISVKYQSYPVETPHVTILGFQRYVWHADVPSSQD